MATSSEPSSSTVDQTQSEVEPSPVEKDTPSEVDPPPVKKQNLTEVEPPAEKETPSEEKEPPSEEKETPSEAKDPPSEEKELPSEVDPPPVKKQNLSEAEVEPPSEKETPSEEKETPSEEKEKEKEPPSEEKEREKDTPSEVEPPPVEKVTSSEASPSLPSHVFQPDWTRLSKEVLIDKIKGVIYGQAIGDAIGLATEFMSKEQSIKTYGPTGPSSYSVIVPDFHRSRWEPGDWTDDTDQMLLIMLSIIEHKGAINEKDIAMRLKNWMIQGFPELGDGGGCGIGMTVSRTLRHHLFLDDPHAAAKDVWEQSGRYLAANGAVMRTSILGVLNFNDLDKVIANTCQVSQVTHADPRCTASCVAVTTAIALMLQGKYDLSKKDKLKALIEESLKCGMKFLELKNQCKEIKDHAHAKNLKVLKLDDSATIGYTFKAMGSGFYGLRTGTDFRKTILELIMEGGDADSNGSVCGAMLGCKLGYSQLPQDLLQFVNRKWLDDQVDKFMATIGLKD